MPLGSIVRALFPANDLRPRHVAEFSGAFADGAWRIVLNGKMVGDFESCDAARAFASDLAAAMRQEGYPARLAHAGFAADRPRGRSLRRPSRLELQREEMRRSSAV